MHFKEDVEMVSWLLCSLVFNAISISDASFLERKIELKRTEEKLTQCFADLARCTADLARCTADLAQNEKKIAALEAKLLDCELLNLSSDRLEDEKKSPSARILLLYQRENHLREDKKALLSKEESLLSKEESLLSKEESLRSKEESLLSKAESLAQSLTSDPRILFADNLIPLPKAHVKRIVVGVPFVDRGEELKRAWDALAENLTRQIEGKTHIIVAGQTFGSGKSTFGSHLFNFGDQRIKSLFEERNGFKDDFIKDSLRETHTVTISLDLHGPDEGMSLPAYTSQLIFVSTLSQLFQVDEIAAREVWLRSCPDVKSCVNLLSSLVLKPIFFHFDEISVLTSHFPSLSPESDRWKIYYEFWRATIPIHSQACFMFISGKVMELDAMGKGLKHSPGKVSQIRLGLLRAKDIKDMLWDSRNDVATVAGSDLLVPDPATAESLAKWLSEMTTGVPRYLEYVLQYMITETQKQEREPKRMIDWRKVDESTIMTVLQKVPVGVPDLAFKSSDVANLIKAARDNLVLPRTFRLRGQHQLFEELANFHGFYVSDEPNDCYRLVLPRLWLKNLKELNYLNPAHLTSVNHLTDKGLLLEYHVEHTILDSCQDYSDLYEDRRSLRASKAFPFLAGTMVKEENVLGCRLLKMEGKVTVKNNKEAVESLLQDLDHETNECILVRPTPKSSFPDLVMFLPKDKSGKRLIVGWQMKNYPNTCLSVSMVQAELLKFTTLTKAEGIRGGVFVMVVNGELASEEINKMKESNFLTAANAPPGLEISANVQVVILSSDQMKSFLGTYHLDAVSGLDWTKDKETREDSQLYDPVNQSEKGEPTCQSERERAG
jgi:hypothetical protein